MYDEFVAEAKLRGRCLPELRVRLAARDGETLFAGIFGDDSQVSKAMIFFHGAGANMNVGYLDLAKDVSANANIAVLVPDLRGHGMSSGERGYAPSKEQVWLDVDDWIAFARKRYPQAELILGGHSAGAALLLNYLTRHERECLEPVAKLVMVAPYWGIRRSQSAPEGQGGSGMLIPNFSSSDTQVFMAYAMTGEEQYRRQIAVHFNYPEQMAAIANLVSGYTPEMAMAVSPRHVAEQLASVDIPLLVLAAEKDALFSPESLEAVVHEVNNPWIDFRRAAGDHLTSLYWTGKTVGAWLSSDAPQVTA